MSEKINNASVIFLIISILSLYNIFGINLVFINSKIKIIILERVNGIILSAGLSSRMYRPKALLPYGTTTFLENLYSTFITVVDKLVIVITPELYIRLQQKNISLSEANFVFNQISLSTRFYSIYIGVANLGESNIFIHNVDVPGISSDTLILMSGALKPGSFVVPVYKGKGGHPVLISREIAAEILKQKEYNINFRDFLRKFKRIDVEVDDEFVVLNVNTPDDLRNLYDKIL